MCSTVKLEEVIFMSEEKRSNVLYLAYSDETDVGDRLEKILTECGYTVERIFSATNTPDVVGCGRWVGGYDDIVRAFVPGGHQGVREIEESVP